MKLRLTDFTGYYMTKSEQKNEDLESDKIEVALRAILGTKRKWVILYEAEPEGKGSIVLAKPESDFDETIRALDFASELIKIGTRYRVKKDDFRIAHGGVN